MSALGARLAVVLAGLLLAAAGCGDDSEAISMQPVEAGDGAMGADADGGIDEDAGVAALCVGVKEGTACGRASEAKHCIDQRCVFNTCGDGVQAGTEACDDGNLALGDACDPACRKVPPRCGDHVVQDDEECDDGNWFDLDACSTACTKNLCGNERIDGDEECDDGDLADDDECSNACTLNRCRNGRLDPGEQCDDGNRTNDDDCSNTCTKNVCGNNRTDPGEVCDADTVAYKCADDCLGTITDTCRPCEEQKCNFYYDYFKLVDGCFQGTNIPSELVPIVDPSFVQNCIDAVNCARQHDCGFDEQSSPITSCYCGSRDTSSCAMDGPGPDAPCAAEWTAATRRTTYSDVLAALANANEPAGWAFLLIQCDREECLEECAP